MAYYQLGPSQMPLAINPNYITRQAETLVMAEKVLSFSDDAFHVKTTDGRDILDIKADTWSPIHHNKNVYDMTGNKLFTIRKIPLHIPVAFECVDAQGHRVLEVKGKFSFGSTKSVALFHNNATNSPGELHLHGAFLSARTEIKNAANDQVIATLERSRFDMGNIFAGRQTYTVTIAPGVDLGLIVACCVCMDERRDERRDQNGI